MFDAEIMNCLDVGGDDNACRSTQTTLDGTTVLLQDVPRQWIYSVIVFLCCSALRWFRVPRLFNGCR